MNPPIDQRNRERFASELAKNFSVVAAAGSGKTRAITDRIVQIARNPQAVDWLPQLVVVAFTNRAADEMQQRARTEILRAGVSSHVLAAFNRAFFGTIHSLCVQLLEIYGHHLGLPPKFDLITNDDELWNEFVQQQTTVGRSLSEKNRRELLRHVQVRHLMELGRRGELNSIAPLPEPCPTADFRAIYKYRATGAALQTIPGLQEDLKSAETVWRETKDFVRWPACNTVTKDFVPLWREAFGPLRRWVDQNSLCVAAEVQRDYRDFRLERGVLTYDDQVALALELIRQPDAASQIREKKYRVILDEAQDTDPQQFSLLLELARRPAATGEWLENWSNPPRPGHFCMVGDFQQSIYRDRADLSKYRRIHQTLVDTGVAEELEFSVTFRLDTSQLEFVNQTFREILNDTDNQVGFVELSPRPEILPGQVVRLNLHAGNLIPDARGRISDARKAAEEARQLAQWLRATDLKKFRAQSWRDVAVLCPRKEWLQTLRRGLRDAGFAVQIQSEKEWKGDSPAYAWLTALVTIMVDPRNGYEIAGALREVFGISDHELALFSWGEGNRFQIKTETNTRGLVPETLQLLTQVRLSILDLPVFDAVNEIVRRTRLRERLLALPSEDFEDLEGELDALLALSAAAENEHGTLSVFAESLRTHFADAREVRPSSANAIQLITCQKAKGSEWQAVIVPFLAREVRSLSPRYPRLLRNRRTGEVSVLLDSSDVTADVKAALDLEERQEMERLLYVALTRAKHTLVLAFDHALFAKNSGDIHKDSQAKWLRADEVNQSAFESIDAAPSPCADTAARYEGKEKAGGDEAITTAINKKEGLAKANLFVRKLNPSELPSEEKEAVRTDWSQSARAPRSASPALRYGLWWHDFAQCLTWTAATDTWNKLFNEHRKISTDPARSSREWKLLLAHLSGPESFRQRPEGQSIAHAEMPFFLRIDEGRCLEGIIDLALFQPAARRWLILDWKTDRVPPDNKEILRARYRPQLAAYWKAVRELTKMEVEAAVYSTAAGALIRYDPEELAKEWARLEALPPDQFDATVSGGANVQQPVEPPFGQLEFSAFNN